LGVHGRFEGAGIKDEHSSTETSGLRVALTDHVITFAE